MTLEDRSCLFRQIWTFLCVRALDMGLRLPQLLIHGCQWHWSTHMLTILGRKYRHCDGITRRHFLTAGALGISGLTLADLLRAEAMASVGSSSKAVINIHLDGGPPHMDTID